MKKLKNQMNSSDNWQHGFNSGVLATLRLIDGGKIRYEDWEEFPMLDTQIQNVIIFTFLSKFLV